MENFRVIRHGTERDWVALTTAAARWMWTFIADHRSQAHLVLWRGSALDPFLLLLPEQTGKIGLLQRWLLRVVDVEKALSVRGYPLHFSQGLSLSY